MHPNPITQPFHLDGLTTIDVSWDCAATLLADSVIQEHNSGNSWDKYQGIHPTIGRIVVVLVVTGPSYVASNHPALLERDTEAPVQTSDNVIALFGIRKPA